jgi:hypothetical protein
VNTIQIIVDNCFKCYLSEHEWELINCVEALCETKCKSCGHLFPSTRRWREDTLASIFGFVCNCGAEFAYKGSAVRHRVVSWLIFLMTILALKYCSSWLVRVVFFLVKREQIKVSLQLIHAGSLYLHFHFNLMICVRFSLWFSF